MKKNKLWFFLAGALFICGAAAYLIFFSGFFIVKSVDLIGELSCVDNRQLLASIDIVGLNIFLTDSSRIEKTFKTNFSCVKSVKIIRKFPKTILVQVSRREPRANLYIIKDTSIEATSSAIEESFLLDEEGVIFSGTAPEMPMKIYSSRKNINFRNILAILNKIKVFGIEVMEAVETENILLINSSPKIVFDLSKEIDAQTASLQLILAKAKIDEETAEFIDLRFDKPVVRFAPKKK